MKLKFSVGLIAQLVEHCMGIAEVMGSNPVKARILKISKEHHLCFYTEYFGKISVRMEGCLKILIFFSQQRSRLFKCFWKTITFYTKNRNKKN